MASLSGACSRSRSQHPRDSVSPTLAQREPERGPCPSEAPQHPARVCWRPPVRALGERRELLHLWWPVKRGGVTLRAFKHFERLLVRFVWFIRAWLPVLRNRSPGGALLAQTLFPTRSAAFTSPGSLVPGPSPPASVTRSSASRHPCASLTPTRPPSRFHLCLF